MGACRPYGAAKRYNDAVGCWAYLIRQAEAELDLSEHDLLLLKEGLTGVRLDPRLKEPGRYLADLLANLVPSELIGYLQTLEYVEAWALYLKAVR